MRVEATLHPTMRRENTSVTKATKANQHHVATSATQRRRGATAMNLRCSRSRGFAFAGSGFVVKTFFINRVTTGTPT